jgi:hypothetical protein
VFLLSSFFSSIKSFYLKFKIKSNSNHRHSQLDDKDQLLEIYCRLIECDEIDLYDGDEEDIENKTSLQLIDSQNLLLKVPSQIHKKIYPGQPNKVIKYLENFLF